MTDKKPKFSQVGPYYVLTNGASGTEQEMIEAMTQAIRKLRRDMIAMRGKTPSIDDEITMFFEDERRAKAKLQMVKAHGISDGLRRLLAATTKRDVERIARDLTISKQDLASLRLNCAELGFTHRFFAKEFRPPDMGDLQPPANLTEGEGKGTELTTEGAKWFKQMGRVFRERQQLHVHLYEKGDNEFHFFFFDFGDVAGRGASMGSHIHYSSHLWNLPKEDTFKDFENKGERPSNLHIKYQDDARE